MAPTQPDTPSGAPPTDNPRGSSAGSQELTSAAIACVVIAYNEERTIGPTLESILDQDPRFSTVIVVDDGSTDATADIVRSYAKDDLRVHLESLGVNRGRGAARARGVEVATAPLIAMVDADILLPPMWLATCLSAIHSCDAVGGVPVPDGDVTYLARHFDLTPKVRPAAAQVTGSNGLYRHEALHAAGLDPKLREGEDVALNEDLAAGGFVLATLHDLVVRHNEYRTFPQAIRWLYQSGRGASRQLRRYKRVRTPDLALLGFVITSSAAIPPGRTSAARRLLPGLYLLGVGFAHLSSRFELGRTKRSVALKAGCCNTVLIGSYFLGRLTGALPGDD